MLNVGDFLIINGDARDNVIQVADNGGGDLIVNGNSFSGIRNLICNTKGGADEFYYSVGNGELSLSNIHLDLGAGNDVAHLNLGTVAADLQSTVNGGAGTDVIDTVFEAVEAGVHAKSVMNGGAGNDIIRCVQRNVSGSASCENHGGAGDDYIVCESSNVLENGQSECVSKGGQGNDTIACTKTNIAGTANCIGDGGSGDDDLSCVLDVMAATGSGLCHQTGGAGNDILRCETRNISGEHVCFQNGGAGNDTLNWIVKGVNSANAQCSLYGGAGNDVFNGELGTFEDELTITTGTVSFLLDAGPGNDHFNFTANLSAASDATISSVAVLLGAGNDTATLNLLSLGGAVMLEQLYDGGRGRDTYEGNVPAMFLPLVNFEAFLPQFSKLAVITRQLN
jgi:hypothetical protein